MTRRERLYIALAHRWIGFGMPGWGRYPLIALWYVCYPRRSQRAAARRYWATRLLEASNA